MAGQQWKKGGGDDNAKRMPRWGLFLLSRATDEPQMDGQLLWVSEPGEVGVTWDMCVYFEELVSRSRGHLGVKV